MLQMNSRSGASHVRGRGDRLRLPIKWHDDSSGLILRILVIGIACCWCRRCGCLGQFALLEPPLLEFFQLPFDISALALCMCEPLDVVAAIYKNIS